jgi:bifunctional ADP-heptose synthase (sugar kinase/adenylyltransferase)
MTLFAPSHAFDPMVPADILDHQFVFDLSGDTIATADVTVSPAGMTVSDVTGVGDTVTARLTGGTAGQVYTVTATITTAAGREYNRSASLTVQDVV